MDAGKEIGGTAAIAATRLIAAPDAVGLLTPKGELSAADGMRRSPPRTPDSATAGTALPSSKTVAELSSGAQLLLKLMAGGAQPAPPLQGAQPLLAAAPLPGSNDTAGMTGTTGATGAQAAHSGTAIIAQALQGALETSGLFYESHLADWVGGQRSLDAIRSEPQAQLHSLAATSDAASNAMPDNGITNVAALNSIVNAQLDVIDNGQLRWQGELWPGMPAEIWLQRDMHDSDGTDARQRNGQDADEPDGRRWQAKLVTTLPALGKISTRFTLQGERLDLMLSSPDTATAGALKAAAPQLAGSLQATGLTLQAFASQVDPASQSSMPRDANDAG